MGCWCGSKRCHTAVQGERGETMRVHEEELPQECGLDPMIYVYELPPEFNTWLVANPDPGASFGTREVFYWLPSPHSSTGVCGVAQLSNCARLWPSQPPLEIKQSPGRTPPNCGLGQWEVRELWVGFKQGGRQERVTVWNGLFGLGGPPTECCSTARQPSTPPHLTTSPPPLLRALTHALTHGGGEGWG